MYDNLREKQYEKECQDGDNPSAPSEDVSADINPDPDSLLKLGQEIVRDPSGFIDNAVKFCDLHWSDK